jgi:hypothetical protein
VFGALLPLPHTSSCTVLKHGYWLTLLIYPEVRTSQTEADMILASRFLLRVRETLDPVDLASSPATEGRASPA